MKQCILKITFILLGLSLSYSHVCGQSFPRVAELSQSEFIKSIRSTDQFPFLGWLNDEHETKAAIIRLDAILGSVNSLVLVDNYDSIYSISGDDTLAELMQKSTWVKGSLGEVEDKAQKREMRTQLATAHQQIAIQVSAIKSELLQSVALLCGMMMRTDAQRVAAHLSYLATRETSRDLHLYYAEWSKSEAYSSSVLSPYETERNLTLISQRLEKIDHAELMLYASSTSTQQKIKSIEVNHGNDIFTDFSLLGINQDREMTGSFRISVTTDFFKARFLNLGKPIVERILKIDHSEVLSYQTLTFGGIGFTPYIRYQDNIELADTFHAYDRPFGSFVYIARSKNRLWQKGLVRQMGEFQVGFVGLEAPDVVQASLHRDVVTSSQRVYGWDKQIGSPGRLAIQLNHDFDFLLLSNTNKYKGLLNKQKASLNLQNESRYSGANLIGTLEGKIGSYMTAIGGGVRFSTLDFMKQSGQHIIKANQKKEDEVGVHFETGLKYRRVIHNAMLEGIGFLKPFDKDSFDIDPINVYTLTGNTQVQRNMFYFDWKVVFRYRKMAFYLQQTFHNLAYKVTPFDANSAAAIDLLTSNPSFDTTRENHYNETIREEYSSLYDRGWYGFGTIGMTWLLD